MPSGRAHVPVRQFPVNLSIVARSEFSAENHGRTPSPGTLGTILQILIMTKRLLTIFIFLLTLGLTKAYAGWYECYNFTGTIDKYSITLSLQVRQGFFGEKDKKDFNIIGVYKYDKHNDPIRLEGKINFKDNKALLYEIHNNKHSATFEFNFSKNECSGVWRNLSTNKTMPLHLNFVSQLIDTLDKNQSTNIEILQANSLTGFYFIGEYSKIVGESRAQMDKLRIIRKKDNITFQTIDFSKIETQTGNVMTIIFDNVEVINAKTKELNVTNNIGRMGGFLTIYFDSKTQKFRLNPNPEIDGPN